MNSTDTRTGDARYGASVGSGLSASARTSARTRLSAIESSDEFDTLTDLFLGEVAPRPGAASDPAPADSISSPALEPSLAERASTPDLQAVASQFATDSEPAAHSPTPQTTSQAARVEARRIAGAGTALVECVVIGHVPTLASAWATQYAREVARASGKCVAMLRFRSGTTIVEIVDDSDLASDALQASDTVEQAIQTAARRCTRWIVHADPAIESVLAAHHSVGLITLLTGADEAARVAGYGAVKRLSEHLPAPDAAGPMIRVATIGVSPDQAAAAGQKIVEAVRQFLGRDAQHAACPGRVRSTRAPHLLYMGETTLAPEDAIGLLTSPGTIATTDPDDESQPAAPERDASHDLADVNHAIEHPHPMTPAAAFPDADTAHPNPPHSLAASAPEHATEADSQPQPSTPTITAAFERDVLDLTPLSPAAAETRVAPTPMTPVADRASHSESDRSASAVHASHGHAEEPVVATPNHVRSTNPDGEASLASHLRGLDVLAVRCPQAQDVEIAIDEHGRTHLLADGRGGEWKINQAIADLTIAQAWLESYAFMILPAGTRASRPCTHLFIDQPKRGRRVLDTALQVHLLTSVSLGQQNATVCIELN